MRLLILLCSENHSWKESTEYQTRRELPGQDIKLHCNFQNSIKILPGNKRNNPFLSKEIFENLPLNQPDGQLALVVCDVMQQGAYASCKAAN